MRYLVAMALLLLVDAPVQAADSRVLVDAGMSSDFTPSAIGVVDPSSFWSAGDANQLPLLLRYASTGQPGTIRYIIADNQIEHDFLAAAPDGSVTLATLESQVGLGLCMLRHFDVTAQFTWQMQLHGLGSDTACPRLRSDGGGGLWLLPVSTLYVPFSMVDPDGVLHSPISPPAGSFIDIAPDPTQAIAYAAGTLPDASGTQTIGALWRVTRGEVELLSQAPDAGTRLAVVGIGSDTNVYAFGTIGAAPNASLYGMAFNRTTGALVWAHDLSIAGAQPTQVLAVPGGVAVLLNDGYALTVLKVDAAGHVEWAAPSEALLQPSDTTPAMAVAADGDVTVAQKNFAQPALVLRRYDATGSPLYSDVSAPVLAGYFFDLTMLPDGTSLAAGPGFVRNDTHGTALTPPATDNVVPQASFDLVATVAPDGSSFYLASNPDANQLALIALSPSGVQRWRLAFPVSGTHPAVYESSLILRQQDVCFSTSIDGSLVLRCYGIATGAATLSTVIAPVVGDSLGLLSTATPQGDVVVAYVDPQGLLHHVLIDPTGAILHDTTPLQGDEEHFFPALDGDGNLGVIVAVDHVVKIAADGTRAWTAPISIYPYRIRLSPDGGAILSSMKFSGQPVSLQRIDATGSVVWTTPLPNQPSYANVTSMKFVDNDVYFALGSQGRPTYPSPSVIARLSLGDGQLVWQWPSQTFDSNYAPILLPDPEAHRLTVLAQGAVNRMNLSLIDTDSGADVSERVDGCGRDSCRLEAASVGSDGSLRVIHDTTDSISGSTFQLSTYATPFPDAGIRADQPGIAGVWYAPYASGRGFVLDYLPDSRTVFMPWFTFGSTGTPDTADVAWYTLQGNVDAAASSVPLTLFSTTPGTFASGTTSTVAVGTATLSFDDCSHGTLRYAFTAGADSGRSGTISLSRLSAAIASCTLADGSTQRVTAPSPAKGFDVAQSGSWYDPANSGQGVELSVLPSTATSAGQLFGAWFTYDPQGAGNDAMQHHWFSLQGDFSKAAQGVVVVPIYQTLGTQLEGQPTHNIQAVGSATLTMTSCSQATLAYRFDSPLAHAFYRAQGTLHLTHFGANCP